MDSFRRSFIVLFSLCFCLAVLGQMESSLACRRYTTQDGLPQMQAERLWQDSRGYIYIGTLSGFVRFDGRAFTPFLRGRRLNIVGFAEVGDSNTPPTLSNLPPPRSQSGDTEVRALGFFRQWAVGFDEAEPLALDPSGHWFLNNLNAGSLPNGYVLTEDSLEQHRRLCRMTKRGLETLLASPLLDAMTPDRKIYLDTASGDIAVPLQQGVFCFRKGAKKAVRLTGKHDVFTMQRTDEGLLAFATDGIYVVEDYSLRLLASANWTATSYGLTVRQLRTGGLVVADEHAVYLCHGKEVRPLVTGINLIRDVLVDCWDRLWVATYQGVYCFFNRCFTNHWLAETGDIVRAVATGPNGQMVMGTLNGKLLVDGKLIDNDPRQFYAPSAVRVGRDVYMAGNGDVLRVAGNADGTMSARWLGLPADRYQFVGRAWGKLIVGTRNGIFAYNSSTGSLDTLTTKILHPWCASTDAQGLLWIGSSSGLFSIDKARRVRKTTFRSQKFIVTAMDADGRGNVFFASADSVFVVRKGRVEALNAQMHQLSGHEVRALHVSPRGFLVVAVVDGLFVSRIDSQCRPSGTQFFNHLNGFTMTEPLKAVMAESADGTVWLPGVEQMATFRPAELLATDEKDTYISPPIKWWQHWWVWLAVLLVVGMAVWVIARWYEKRRTRRRMMRLQREKLQREEQIDAIRKKAMAEVNSMPEPTRMPSELAQDIVKMTEKSFEERMTLRTASGTIVVDVKDIAYFKGDGNYSQIVTFHGVDTVLLGLGALEKMLSAEVFVRADRSTLVNIHHVSALLPKQRRCIFRSPTGQEVETTLLVPAFKRLQNLL